ncbi:MAG: Hpt domain-containing protein, partial [Myxococcales bacterium]|nr:Hpt domain-containing protein [Myxococcales bacterium]
MSSSALATFAVDAVDIVEEVERWSLVLEQSPSQPAALHGLFRALHTLKGAAACVGLTTLSELVHQIEDSASAVRDGRLTPTKAFIDAVLSAVDLFRRLVHVAEQGEAALAAVNGREAVLEMFAHTVE